MKVRSVAPLFLALSLLPIAGHADLDAVIDGALQGASEAAIEQTLPEGDRYPDRKQHDRDGKGPKHKDHPVGHPGYHCPPGQAKKGRC